MKKLIALVIALGCAHEPDDMQSPPVPIADGGPAGGAEAEVRFATSAGGATGRNPLPPPIADIPPTTVDGGGVPTADATPADGLGPDGVIVGVDGGGGDASQADGAGGVAAGNDDRSLPADVRPDLSPGLAPTDGGLPADVHPDLPPGLARTDGGLITCASVNYCRSSCPCYDASLCRGGQSWTECAICVRPGQQCRRNNGPGYVCIEYHPVNIHELGTDCVTTSCKNSDGFLCSQGLAVGTCKGGECVVQCQPGQPCVPKW